MTITGACSHKLVTVFAEGEGDLETVLDGRAYIDVMVDCVECDKGWMGRLGGLNLLEIFEGKPPASGDGVASTDELTRTS